MISSALSAPRIDLRTGAAELRREVLDGLFAFPKTLPCKLFYDAAGSALFDRICTLPEYYPTRTEMGILRDRGREIARFVGPRALVIGYGTGSGRKTRLLLDALRDPAGYIAIDIAAHVVIRAAEKIALDFPDLPVLPVCADFVKRLDLDLSSWPSRIERRVGFFPGSTIGNLDPDAARSFLVHVAEFVGRRGGLVLGVDLVKDEAILEAAYNDSAGVTAAFNQNALLHVNRLFGADFDLGLFRHRAWFDRAKSRIEMHLVSTRNQIVHLGPYEVAFKAGETIHTENSYKWRLEDLAEFSKSAGFTVDAVWTDPKGWFAVVMLAT